MGPIEDGGDGEVAVEYVYLNTLSHGETVGVRGMDVGSL
jgi:hypothetical protein